MSVLPQKICPFTASYKQRILVYPGETEIGLEIAKALMHRRDVELVSASNNPDSVAKHLYKQHIHIENPVDSCAFSDEIRQIIHSHHIDAIFPAHDSVGFWLSVLQVKLPAQCLSSPFSVWDVCRSKSKTYKAFKNYLPVPKTYSTAEGLFGSYPLFIKPDEGQGSQGARMILRPEDITPEDRERDILIMEYLPGKEVTVDCYTTYPRRNLLYCEARERTRTRNGISVESSFLDAGTPPCIRAYAERIMTKLPELCGAWFFQLKQNKNGGWVLLEIAPRIAGTSALTRAYGVNLPLLHVLNGRGEKVDRSCYTLQHNQKPSIIRYLKNVYAYDTNNPRLKDHFGVVYIDLDDTLIIDNQLNIQAISFVFQCLNEGKRVILLTQHSGNLKNTLKKHRIHEVFDEIIHVADVDDRISMMKWSNCIYVDDSFNNRVKVKSLMGCPVFDVSQLEALTIEKY